MQQEGRLEDTICLRPALLSLRATVHFKHFNDSVKCVIPSHTFLHDSAHLYSIDLPMHIHRHTVLLKKLAILQGD